MLAVQSEHAPAAHPVGFRVADADVAVLEYLVGGQVADEPDNERAGVVVAPVGKDVAVAGRDAGGEGFADFAAQGVEHNVVGTVAFLQRVAHGNQVGDAFGVAVGIVGVGQVQLTDGIQQEGVVVGGRGRWSDGGSGRLCRFIVRLTLRRRRRGWFPIVIVCG